MGLFDENLYEFNVVDEISGFYEAFQLHQRYVVHNRVIFSTIGLLAVATTTITVRIILQCSHKKKFVAFTKLIIAQIMLSCVVAVYMPLCGLYSVLPYRIIFNVSPIAWNSPCMSIISTIVLSYLIMVQVQLSAFMMLRNALLSTYYSVGSLTHQQTVRIGEVLLFVYYALVLVVNFVPISLSVDWQQAPMAEAAVNVDARLTDFFAVYSPFFIVFRKSFVPIAAEFSLHVVVLVVFLFYLVYLTRSCLFLNSLTMRRLQKKILLIELITIASFFVTTAFPIGCTMVLTLIGPNTISSLPLLTIFWAPAQTHCLLVCGTYLGVIAPFRDAFLKALRRGCSSRNEISVSGNGAKTLTPI